MKKAILASCIAACTLPASAQQQLGIATDNYNTLNSLYINPANLGACKEKFAINLFSFGLGVDNNLGKLVSVSDISTNGSDVTIFKPNGSGGKFSMMVPSIELRGPAFLYRINAKHAVALTTRVRAFNQFNNFDRSLYVSLNDPSSVNTAYIAYNANNFNWTAHLWSETGLTYGGEVFSNDMFSVRAGATLRLLRGIGYVGFKGKNMDVNYTAANDSFRANNTDVEFATNIRSIDEGLADNVSGRLTGNGGGAKGFGADIGAVLTYKKSPDEDGYTGLFSFAVRDLGSIKYNTSSYVTVLGNGAFKASELGDNVDNYQQFRSYIATKGFVVDTGTATRTVYMPTNFVVAADYKAYKRLYVNATFVGNLASDIRFGSKYYSQLTVTPRFQSKVFTVAMPVSFNMLANNLRMGLGFRLYAFYMGSDDMLAMFGSSYGFNMYMGAMIPIYKKAKNKSGNY